MVCFRSPFHPIGCYVLCLATKPFVGCSFFSCRKHRILCRQIPMSPRTVREEFTEKQKAMIFARDKALCTFSGKSLRVLDYWLSNTMDIDWAEHIRPASKWWLATLENGVCASSFFNWKKQDNSMDTHYFFKNWKPTAIYYQYWWKLPDWYVDYSKRFEKLHFTDWYFNRALSRFHWWLDVMYNAEFNGKNYKRWAEFYSKSTLVYFTKWKKSIARHSELESMGDRCLIPEKLSFDQQKFLDMSEYWSSDEIFDLMQELYVFYKASRNAMEHMSTLTTKRSLEDFCDRVNKDILVIEKDKLTILSNLRLIFCL